MLDFEPYIPYKFEYDRKYNARLVDVKETSPSRQKYTFNFAVVVGECEKKFTNTIHLGDDVTEQANEIGKNFLAMISDATGETIGSKMIGKKLLITFRKHGSRMCDIHNIEKGE